MSDSPPNRVIKDMRDSGMCLKLDPASNGNPVKIFSLLACEEEDRADPTTPCYCPYVLVHKTNRQGKYEVDGVLVPICMIETSYASGRLFKSSRTYSPITAEEHASILSNSNVISVPSIMGPVDHDEAEGESNQVLEPVLEQSNPASVRTSAAENTGRGNIMQNMSPPGVNPAASNQQIIKQENRQLERGTPQVGNGRRDVMPGSSKTVSGNNKGTQQVPPVQPTPAPNKKSVRQPTRKRAPRRASHRATTPKLLPFRTAPPRKARQARQEPAGKGRKGAAGRDKLKMSSERMLGVIKCEGTGRRTPTSRCYCVGREVYKTNEEGEREYAGLVMPVCMLKQCYGIKDEVGKVDISCASTVVVDPEEFEDDRYPGNGDTATSTFNELYLTQHGFLMDPPVFKEPSAWDLKHGIPLVPLEGFEGRNVVKRPGEASGEDNERVRVLHRQPRLAITVTTHAGTIALPKATRDSGRGNGVAGKLNKKLSSPTAPPRKEHVVKRDRKAMKKCWLAQLCSFPGISRGKAVAIAKRYAGPKELFDAYRSCSIKMGRKLLADIEYVIGWGTFARRETIGYLRSRTIYEIFNTPLNDVIPEAE